jgi:apolipoprotein N-acyltransferase
LTARTFACAVLGGALFCLGYAGYGLWPFALVAWVPLWIAIDSARSRRGAALAGFVFGWTAHAGGFSWLWRLVDVFFAGQVALGATLWFSHSIWFASGWALYALLYAGARERGWPVALGGVAPLLAVEWLWPSLFPVHLGDALVERTAWIQIADLGGPLLVSALAIAANVAAFEAWRWLRGARSKPLAIWVAVAGAFVFASAYGVVRAAAIERAIAQAPALRVGIVQANLDPLDKRRDPERVHAIHLALSRALLAEESVDLLVWPETVYTRGIRGPLPVAGRPIRSDLDVPLLFGAASLRTESGRSLTYNSAFLIGPDGSIRDGYDKNLLVPFAERLPLAGWTERWLPHARDFGAAQTTPSLRLGAFRIATPICYETVVPGFVRRMVREGDANLIVSLANDGWFGDSQEPWLHLALARFRAVEQRRFVVRATNSGVSAVIDPLGRVLQQTPLLESTTLRASVHALDVDSPYRRFGDWPGWIAVAAVASMLAAPRRAV